IFAMGLPPGPVRRWMTLAASLGALALPVLLLMPHLSLGWAARYAALVVISLAAALLAASRIAIVPSVSVRDAVAGLVGLGLAIAAIAIFPLSLGSTVHGMIDSMIIMPRMHFSVSWALPLQVREVQLAWAVGMLGIAAAIWLGRQAETLLAA